MKLGAFVFLLLSSVVSAFGAPLIQRQTFELTYAPADVSLDDVVVQERTYKRVFLHGAAFLPETIGEPELPTARVLLILPPDVRDVFVENVDSTTAVAAAGIGVAPRQPDVSTGAASTTGNAVPAGDDTVQFLGTAVRYGARVALFRVAPLFYDAKSRQLSLRTRIRTTITYASPSPATGLYPDLSRGQRDALRREAINGAVLNGINVTPLRVGSTSLSDAMFIVHGSEPAKQDEVPYVIITSQPLASSFQLLADWRTTTGDSARVVTVDWIAQHYPGVDDANRIRNFVLDALARWKTSWVLIGGDVDQVQSRYGFYDSQTSSYGPTDLYFAALNGAWNDDGSAIFGEPADAADIDPELFTGRAPVSTPQEVANFTQKVLTYEQSPPQYVDSALLMGVSGLGSNAYKQNAIRPMLPSSYSVARLYDSFSSIVPTATLNEANAVSYVNQGYHVINHMDHSGIDGMGTGASEGGGALTTADASAFTNGNRASIVWTYGCDPNAFDYESISEAWMNDPNGGAVAFVGNTRTGYTSQASQDSQFFQSWFTTGTDRIGELLASTQGSAYGQYHSAAMNLLGDPAMPVWIHQPAPLAVTTSGGALQTQTNTLTVTVGNLPAGREATITLAKPNDNVYITQSTTGGTLSIPLALHTAGTLQITARAKDFLPWTGTLPVSQSAASHVYVSAVQIDDANGNANQRLESGESATVRLTLSNGGASASASAIVTLSSSTTGATITGTGNMLAPAIASGGSTIVAFPIALANIFADGDAITLELNTGSITEVVLPVFAPELEQTHVYSDSGNGIPEPGDTIAFPLHVINNGFGDAHSVTATLTTTSSTIIITTPSIIVGDVPRKSAVDTTTGLQLTLSPSFSPTSDTVTLTLTDSLGNAFTRVIQLIVPAPPTGLTTRGNAHDIKVIWDPSANPASRNYSISRGPVGGPYARLGAFLLRDASLYDDTTANGSQTYEYRVTTIDQYGNESAEASKLAIPSLNEDPNFPRSVTASDGAICGHIATYDVDHDGKQEIFALTRQSQMGPGKLYAWRADGSALIQIDDPNFAEFAHLDGAGVGVPAFADIDGDHQDDIVVNGRYKIYAFHADGSAVAGWQGGIAIPQMTQCGDTPSVDGSSPAVADLDGDHVPEIVIEAYDWIHYCDGSNAHIYVYDHTGTLLKQYDFPLANYTFGTPAFGDLDGNGDQEVVFAMQRNPSGSYHESDVYVLDTPLTLTKLVTIPNAIFSNEVGLGDLDGDKKLDIVVSSSDAANGRVYAFDRNGNALNGWQGGVPIDASDRPVSDFAFSTAPALADLDCDGKLDVVVTGEDKLYIFNSDGSRKSGWPVVRDGRPGPSTSAASPIIADVDGDADLDVVLASTNTNGEGVVEAWDVQTALPVSHFPVVIDDGIFRTPAIADIDNDGRVEVIAGANRTLHVWNTAGFGRLALMVWPQIHRDAVHTSAAPIVTVDRSYLFADPLFCAQVSFTCVRAARPYEDACGCGCIPRLIGPDWGTPVPVNQIPAIN